MSKIHADDRVNGIARKTCRGKLGEDPRSKAVQARFSARKIAEESHLHDRVHLSEENSSWKTRRGKLPSNPRVNEAYRLFSQQNSQNHSSCNYRITKIVL